MMNFDEVNLNGLYLLCTQRQTTGWTSWGERVRFCLPFLLRASITESAPFSFKISKEFVSDWLDKSMTWVEIELHYNDTFTSDAHYFVVNSEH